jgi:ATP:corrinoid adenosyltransferase
MMVGMPRVPVDEPRLTTKSEKVVWRALCAQTGDEDLLLPNVRVTDKGEDLEVDVLVGFAGLGVVAVEVKGRGIRYDGQRWRIGDRYVDPVEQARRGMYAVRDSLYRHPRWGSRPRIRFAHAVVFPFDTVDEAFTLPDCPRWRIVDRTELDDLAARLRDLLNRDDRYRGADLDDLDALDEWRYGRMPLQRDLLRLADDREAEADRLTQDQGALLDAIRLLPRAEIRGGPGSGKTWLALEQARRLARHGRRVALLCYSRGLASFLTRRTEGWDRKDTPAYIGTFHGLGNEWGIEVRLDNDTDRRYWEQDLPNQMAEAAKALPEGKRFDAVVVDEVQDFAEAWWDTLLAALKDEETGQVYVFADEGQRVFPRFADAPISMPTLLLDQNLRNTRQIADAFGSLGATRMRAVGGDGPQVTFVGCTAEQALGCADDQVEILLDEGWRPRDIALLTTGSRHPLQHERVDFHGQDGYWASYWDDDQPFYGHVLGFKGLERRAVVLAINEPQVRDRSRERLYVGMSRATDKLVICGDPEHVRAVAGEATLARLQAG